MQNYMYCMKIIMENYNGDHKTSKELTLNAQKPKNTLCTSPPPRKQQSATHMDQLYLTTECHPLPILIRVGKNCQKERFS